VKWITGRVNANPLQEIELKQEGGDSTINQALKLLDVIKCTSLPLCGRLGTKLYS